MGQVKRSSLDHESAGPDPLWTAFQVADHAIAAAATGRPGSEQFPPSQYRKS
jgi:hypothetical protein